MLLKLSSLLFSLRVTSMMTSRHLFLYPPLDIKLGQDHDPQQALALALNQHAREERTRIFNNIHSLDQANDPRRNHDVPSEDMLSVEEQKLIDAWIVKIENEFITPTFERDFLILHPVDQSHHKGASGGRKILTNYKHPFTAIYTLNTRERLLNVLSGLEIGFEEASRITEGEIKQWSKETHLTFLAVKMPTDPVDYQFFKLSLSDMIWFGLQRSAGDGERLRFEEIAKVFSNHWLKHPNASRQYSPIEWTSSPVRPLSAKTVPQFSQKREASQNRPSRNTLHDIGGHRPGRKVLEEKPSAPSLVKPALDERPNEAHESLIDSLLDHFGWHAELDFASSVMDTSRWDTVPSRTGASSPIRIGPHHSPNHIQTTDQMNNLLRVVPDGKSGMENQSNDQRSSSGTSLSSSNSVLPLQTKDAPLESLVHSLAHHEDLHTLPFPAVGDLPSRDPDQPEFNQYELLDPYSLPDWSEKLEKFLCDD
ncbi:hypothetical protein Pst134EB_016874 [Puccinia striiformis f. sp. tritici]|nr:hypothetical protein Pst134EB_016874 [Puccinia striiformis f. sp. tritici]